MLLGLPLWQVIVPDIMLLMRRTSVSSTIICSFLREVFINVLSFLPAFPLYSILSLLHLELRSTVFYYFFCRYDVPRQPFSACGEFHRSGLNGLKIANEWQRRASANNKTLIKYMMGCPDSSLPTGDKSQPRLWLRQTAPFFLTIMWSSLSQIVTVRHQVEKLWRQKLWLHLLYLLAQRKKKQDCTPRWVFQRVQFWGCGGHDRRTFKKSV